MWALSDSQFVYISTSTAWWNHLWTHRSQSRGEQPMGMQVVSGLANNSEPWKRVGGSQKNMRTVSTKAPRESDRKIFELHRGRFDQFWFLSSQESRKESAIWETHNNNLEGSCERYLKINFYRFHRKLYAALTDWPFFHSNSISELTRWMTPLTILRLLGASFRWRTCSNFGYCWILAVGSGQWG